MHHCGDGTRIIGLLLVAHKRQTYLRILGKIYSILSIINKYRFIMWKHQDRKLLLPGPVNVSKITPYDGKVTYLMQQYMDSAQWAHRNT